MDYKWDRQKASANVQKHGVRFADAVMVFDDPHAVTIEDDDAEGERRFVTMGLDDIGKLLVVVWTERDNAIRVISARQAEPKERRKYERR